MSFSREFYQVFLLGCSVGVLFTVLYNELVARQLISHKYYPSSNANPTVNISPEEYSRLTNEIGDISHPELPPLRNDKRHGPILFNALDKLHSKGGDEVAKTLARKIRILCWVMTQPKTLHIKGQAVKDTWGKRCNVLIFISSKEDKDFPAVGLDVPEGKLISFEMSIWIFL